MPIVAMDIGKTVQFMREGGRVRRAGWNGVGMWLEYVSQSTFHQQRNFSPTKTLPFIAMRTVQGDFVPWLCSQTDLLARDWEEVT